jgi:oxygen-independent coproporphyrinogen-3 oxidase
MASLVAPPLSLYVHIPWCVRKCPYCDFNSHAAGPTIPEQEYIKALLADLEQDLPLAAGRPLQSIFIGGGTPSLFSGSAIDELLQGISDRIALAPDSEITLEANPGTAEQARFAAFRNAGVNRLSIGIQSFNDARLLALGRIHNGDNAQQAILMAKQAGFEQINLDLMHGLPQQSCQQALQDLQQAIDYAPAHLSWYQLTIEPNTAFYNVPPRLPDEEDLANIQEAGQQLLASSGYSQYEVSAYCRADAVSAHNYNYWLFGDYIGIGAGAHGKLTDISKGEIWRTWKTRQPNDYLDTGKSRLAGSRSLSSEELPLEFMMNALRLADGCTHSLFESRTGLHYDVIEATVTKLIGKGLMSDKPGVLQASPAGQRYLNDLLTAFMP